ncbi:MAG TPA: DUF58 domain-containing protein [Planctomycetota bacterium]|nr:DUF58 domain-containing protein [Planctomycetota bacterium]
MAPYIEYSLTSKTFGKQLETLYQKIRRLLSSRPVTISQKGCAGWEFIGYKKYVPGDNFKRIDWNVFQRWQEIVVREYSMETFRKWWIFWDVSESMNFFYKKEYAQYLIASLSYIALHLGDEVHLSTSFWKNSPDPVWKGISHIPRMLSFLENVPFSTKSTNTPPDITKLRNNSKIIWISDFYDTIHQPIFQEIGYRNLPCVAVHICSEQEKKASGQGKYILQDAETGIQKTIYLSEETKQTYNIKMEEHIKKIHTFCKHYGMSYFLISPKNQIEQYCLEILRALRLFH